MLCVFILLSLAGVAWLLAGDSVIRLLFVSIYATTKRSRKRYERTRNANDREDLRVAEREKVVILRREKTLYFREAIDRLSANPKGL